MKHQRFLHNFKAPSSYYFLLTLMVATILSVMVKAKINLEIHHNDDHSNSSLPVDAMDGTSNQRVSHQEKLIENEIVNEIDPRTITRGQLTTSPPRAIESTQSTGTTTADATAATATIDRSTIVGTSTQTPQTDIDDLTQLTSDSLTKGFSIPTYLPPLPQFEVHHPPPRTDTKTADNSLAAVASVMPPFNSLKVNSLSLEDQLQNEQQQQQPKIAIDSNLIIADTNVTVQAGTHAYLPCNIRRLSSKPLSWVRVRDGHIISVDDVTFIGDQRFNAIFKEDNEHKWSLQIKYVEEADEGWYECQLSSEPKMAFKVYLKVVVPKTEVIGDQNRFVKAGSKVTLHCIVRETLDPPKYIIWFRSKTQITDNTKSGWYTQIDRNIFGNMSSNQNTIGSLIIPVVRKEDSGNFTCQPSNSASISVNLHVLSGEYSASAIMSGSVRYKHQSLVCLISTMVLVLVLALHRT